MKSPRRASEAFFQRQRELFEYSRGRQGADVSAGRQARYERLVNSTYEDLLETRVVFGSPEQVIDRLHEFKGNAGSIGNYRRIEPRRVPAERSGAAEPEADD